MRQLPHRAEPAGRPRCRLAPRRWCATRPPRSRRRYHRPTPPAGPSDTGCSGLRRHRDRDAWRNSVARGGKPRKAVARSSPNPAGSSSSIPAVSRSFRHNEEERFRFGARDIQTQQFGNETRTVVIRPDGTQIITVSGPRRSDAAPDSQGSGGPRDHHHRQQLSRPPCGRRILRRSAAAGDPHPLRSLQSSTPRTNRRRSSTRPSRRPPVDRIERRYSLDEIRYSPSVRQLMPSIDLNTINFETGSWEISARSGVKASGDRGRPQSGDHAQPARGVPDRGPYRCGSEATSTSVAVGSPRRVCRHFADPAIPGPCGKPDLARVRQAISEGTDELGPSRINRRVTVRRITPLLNGGTASLPPPPRASRRRGSGKALCAKALA